MASMTPYSLMRVFCTLNGFRVSGWGEGDAITFEAGDQLATYKVGGDGLVTVSMTNNDVILARITLGETSYAVRVLAELQRAQHLAASTTGLVGYVFNMTDANSGDTVSEKEAFFLDAPLPSKGKESGEREFLLLLPNGRKSVVLGGKLTAG